MDDNLGSIFNIIYHQNQYNESLVSDGIICFESYKKYIFDNSIIRIIYDNTYIKTINKQNKQRIQKDTFLVKYILSKIKRYRSPEQIS